MREQKFQLEKDIIQVKSDFKHKLKRTQSELRFKDEEDVLMGEGSEDEEEKTNSGLGNSSIFETFGGKTVEWLSKNQNSLKKMKQFDNIRKSAERLSINADDHFYSSSDEENQVNESMNSMIRKNNFAKVNSKPDLNKSRTDRVDRGRSLPKMYKPAKLDFQYNVVNQ